MQILMLGFASIALVLTMLLLPETSQPGAREVDKIRAKGEKVGFVILNPFKSLGLLRSPNILLIVSLCFGIFNVCALLIRGKIARHCMAHSF